MSTKLLLIFTFITFAYSAKECGNNSHWKKCVECDYPSCSKTTYYPKSCPEVCKGGCVCNSGYIWNDITRKCVLPRNCPDLDKCSENEDRNFCMGCGGVRRTCYNFHIALKCDHSCTVGCECKPGYVLEPRSDVCIKLKDCPCRKNEYYNHCNELKEKDCIPKCECKKGFTKNKKNKCVQIIITT